MDFDALREIIKTATAHERQTLELTVFLQQRDSTLHHAIEISHNKTAEPILTFVYQYIKHLPELISSTLTISAQAGVEAIIKPSLDLAMDILLHPQEESYGMVILMHNCYVAYRLLEEINERFLARCQLPLAPLNITKSNLIIHHLIGEPLANDMDDAIFNSADKLEERCLSSLKSLPRFNRQEHQKLLAAAESWPAFNTPLAVNITLNRQLNVGLLH